MARPDHLLPPPAPTGRVATPAVQRKGAARARAMSGTFWGDPAQPTRTTDSPGNDPEAATAGKSRPATETIGRRAGSLSDELDFPEFVASLIQGTWDAMVDSSIRQMDGYADLVAAISKPLSQFRDENVTANQARDWLAAQYPSDITLSRSETGATLQPRGGSDEFGSGPSPGWLRDFGLEGQSLSPELLEERLVPMARDRMASDRMQTLATLVMLGMNRIVVKDGSITARLRFRASASDKTSVDYAVGDDPGSVNPAGSWSTRGSTAYAAPVTKVATVGVNAQTDSQLNAELFGEVKINFASETIPLDRFVDDARRTLLERAARPAPIAPSTAAGAVTSATASAEPVSAAPARPAPESSAPPAAAGAPSPVSAPVGEASRAGARA